MYSLIKQIENKKLNSTYCLIETNMADNQILLENMEFFSCDINNNIRLHYDNVVQTISKFSAKKARVKISCMKYNQKFKLLFVGYEDGQLEIYKPSSKKNNIQTQKPHFSSINSISFD